LSSRGFIEEWAPGHTHKPRSTTTESIVVVEGGVHVIAVDLDGHVVLVKDAFAFRHAVFFPVPRRVHAQDHRGDRECSQRQPAAIHMYSLSRLA
jgi:hypothetical protein